MVRDTYQTVPVLHFSDTLKKNHTKKRIHCLIIGNFGSYNQGEEAILAGALNELAKVPNLKVTVSAEYPQEIKRLHSVRAIPLSGIRKEIKKSDFVIILGGGLFNTGINNLFLRAKKLSLLSLLIWKQRVFKKKIYILGLGLHATIPFSIKQLCFSIIKSATLVTVRDQQTLDMLRKKDIHVHLFKDTSYLMDLEPITKIVADPYFKRFYKRNRTNIGLALSKPDSKKEEKHLISEILSFIGKNYENTDFWFYASDHHPKHFSDEKFGHLVHEAIKKKVGKDVQFHFIPTTWNPQLFFTSIKLMDYLISMRKHTSLFAYRNNSNFITIVHNKQGNGFLTALGRDIFSVNDVSAKKLQSRLK